MIQAIPEPYRKHFWIDFDEVFRKTLMVSASMGILLLVVVLVSPQRSMVITDVNQVPERFAKLILKEPAPVAKTETPETAAKKPEVKEEIKPPPPEPKPVRRRKATPVPENVGTAGREKAKKEITKTLSGASSAVDESIKNLTASLGSGTQKRSKRPRMRRGSVSSGRSAGQMGTVNHSPSGTGMSADVAGSGVTGASIIVESITPVSGGGSGSESGGAGEASGSGNPYRSNASLMAVVKRYAPGIQFCYDNELKRSPGIRGKMVVAITVAASGAVTDARVVSNTVGSASLTKCAMAQIREWQFPSVPSGTTVFRAPFVFTPPKE